MFPSLSTWSYHNILNVMLHQVVLGGDQHWSAKRIQIRVVQLVWQAINLVRRLHVDVSERTSEGEYENSVEISAKPNILKMCVQSLTWLLLGG